jgi:hypothetical protein
LCGAFFDATQQRERLKSLEARVAGADFWSNQEAAQAVLRDRKHAEDQVNADEKLAAFCSKSWTASSRLRRIMSPNWKRRRFFPARTITLTPS